MTRDRVRHIVCPLFLERICLVGITYPLQPQLQSGKPSLSSSIDPSSIPSMVSSTTSFLADFPIDDPPTHTLSTCLSKKNIVVATFCQYLMDTHVQMRYVLTTGLALVCWSEDMVRCVRMTYWLNIFCWFLQLKGWCLFWYRSYWPYDSSFNILAASLRSRIEVVFESIGSLALTISIDWCILNSGLFVAILIFCWCFTKSQQTTVGLSNYCFVFDGSMFKVKIMLKWFYSLTTLTR